MTRDLAASIRARLLNLAKAEGSDFNQVLVRFALERFLYRLSASPWAGQFLLKGALLFSLWYDLPHRSTRDADLLGFGSADLDHLRQIFAGIARIAVADGIVFEPDSIQADEIRKLAGYSGARIVIGGELAQARFRTQVDVGFGDAVTPAPVDAIYPVMLADLPAPRLATYPVYSVVAEKVHAIVLLGMTNSRLKDYLDLAVIFEREALDQVTLATAILATFRRRGTALPVILPVGLSEEFASDHSRQSAWRAFLKKNALSGRALPDVVDGLRASLLPIFRMARQCDDE